MEDHVALLEFENNPNIGLYTFVNDKFAIIGCELSKEKKEQITQILGVPIYTTTALGTELIGVFVAGNNEFLLVPEIYDYELKKFEEIAKEHNMKLLMIPQRLNTYGNNICFVDDKIIINDNYNRDFIQKIEKKTQLQVVKLQHKEVPSAGAVCRFINGKLYVSQELDENHAKEFIDKIGGVGTVNSGGIFVSSGILGNKNGVLLGSQCSTIEIQNILEALEFL